MTRPPQDFGPGADPAVTGPVPHPDLTEPMPQQMVAAGQQWAPNAWEAAAPDKGSFRTIMIAFGTGSLVAVAIGVYGGLHDPTGQALNLAGFTDGLHAKAWLATVAVVLAIVQLLTALAMWGKLPGVRGDNLGGVHRWSGRLAVIVSLPVAAHCLYALGFQGFSLRVLAHSLLGCFFYGIFVCKMIVLSRDKKPGWVLPVTGGLVFTALTGLWLTSSLWFFTEFGVHF
jgi:hypothetical protein